MAITTINVSAMFLPTIFLLTSPSSGGRD